MCVFISIVVTIWSVSAASPPAFSALKLVHLRECLISVTRSPCSVCRRSAVCRRRSAARVLSRLAHGVRTIAPLPPETHRRCHRKLHSRANTQDKLLPGESSRLPPVNGDWVCQLEMAMFDPQLNLHPSTDHQNCHR